MPGSVLVHAYTGVPDRHVLVYRGEAWLAGRAGSQPTLALVAPAVEKKLPKKPHGGGVPERGRAERQC